MKDSSNSVFFKLNPELEKAFENLCFNEKFLESSEVIIRWVRLTLANSEEVVSIYIYIRMKINIYLK